MCYLCAYVCIGIRYVCMAYAHVDRYAYIYVNAIYAYLVTCNIYVKLVYVYMAYVYMCTSLCTCMIYV